MGLGLGLGLGLKVEHHALPQQRLRLVHAHRERLGDIGEIYARYTRDLGRYAGDVWRLAADVPPVPAPATQRLTHGEPTVVDAGHARLLEVS